MSQIKSEYIGDAARPGLKGEEYALLSEPCAIGAHPCPTIGACASHYARLIIVVHVRQQHVTKMPLAEDNNMVKAFPPDRTDQPFSICVLPWGARRRRSIANPHGSNSSNNDFAIGPVPVADQIARGLLPVARVRDLICDPFCGRMRGNAEP